MTVSKSSFLSVGIPWLITIAVAVVFVFARKKDVIDVILVLALLILSGRRTFVYLKNRKGEGD